MTFCLACAWPIILIILYNAVFIWPTSSKLNGTWKQDHALSMLQLNKQGLPSLLSKEYSNILASEEAIDKTLSGWITSSKSQNLLKRKPRSLEETENDLNVCPSKNEIDDYRESIQEDDKSQLEQYFKTDLPDLSKVIRINNNKDCFQERKFEISTTTRFNVTVDNCCANTCNQEIHLNTVGNTNFILKFTDFNTPGSILYTSSGEMICNTEALDIVAITMPSINETQEYTVDRFCGFKHPTIVYVDQSHIKIVLMMRNNKECRDRINFNVIVVPCLESKVDTCHEYHNTLTYKGSISTPGLESHGQYFNNQTCNWKISIPRGKFILVYASTFDLGDGDVLKILISASNTNMSGDFHESGVFSNTHPFTNPILLSTNECFVKFSSDQKLPGKGFKLYYEPVEENEFIQMYNNQTLDHSKTPKLPEFKKCNFDKNCPKESEELGCLYEQPNVCLKGFVFKDKCYQISFSKNPLSWIDAETFCHKHYNGHLVALNTVQERSVYDVVSEFFETNLIFLGLYRMNMVYAPKTYRRLWKWVDGTIAYYLPSQLDYKSWDSCAMFNGQVFFATDCMEPKQNVTIVCEIELEGKQEDRNFTVNSNGKNLLRSDHELEVFECGSGEYVDLDRKCNGDNDCFDASDESRCLATTEHRRLAKYTCSNSGTVGYSFVCDGIPHCIDASDEDFCQKPSWRDEDENKLNTYYCSGRTITSEKYCNGIEDCSDNSDEESCLTCQGHTTLCSGLYCMPDSWLADGEYDCPIPDWQVDSLIESDSKTSISHNLEPPGIVIPDGYGKVTIQPLSSIDLCPDTHFQCKHGFCIPFYMLCNGISDCPYEEDELDEICQKLCYGNYKCRGSKTCIPFANVCDGHYDCLDKDDEVLCEMEKQRHKFPDCEWTQRELTCTKLPRIHDEIIVKSFHLSFSNLSSLENVKLEQYSLISLNASHNKINRLTSTHLTYYNLISLDLSNNHISSLDDDNVFEGCLNLQYLILSSNRIEYLHLELFKNIPELRELYISDNRMFYLYHKQFLYVPNIVVLDFKNNEIDEISGEPFFDLHRLRTLDLTGNPVTEFSSNAFHDLKELEYLSSENFRLCCYGVRPSQMSKKGTCLAPSDEISSCEDMLRLDFFRVSHWIMAVLTILGNSAVIVYRIFLDKTKRLTFRIIITCLAVCDLLMGVYLVIIGVADRVYRDEFVLYENDWKESLPCQISGFLCVLSSEGSSLFILVATLDRVTAIAFPFRPHLQFSNHKTIVICIVTWSIAISISSLPLISPFRKWRLYSQTSVGIPLPITRDSFTGYEFGFGVFIVLNMVIFVCVLLGQALIWFSIKGRSKILNNHERTKQDLKIAKHLFLVVLTDCLCWFPITVMGVMAKFGVPIPGVMYVVTTVYLLPANSALNPFLYTIHAFLVRRKERKQTTQERLE